jgi:DNA replication protein DnaC
MNSVSDSDAVLEQCPEHGPFNPRRISGIVRPCPRCLERTEQQIAQKEVDRKRAAEERRQLQQLALLWAECGVPKRFQSATFESFSATTEQQSQVLRRAQSFATVVIEQPDKGASMILCGNVGTGKTHLACAIARVVVNGNCSARFETVLSAMRCVKDTYRRDSEITETDALSALIDPALLILDEVGVQGGSEHEMTLLFEVLNERYQNCRSTILISNLTADRLAAFLGDRVMDRFREMGGILPFAWQSHRGVRA